jgi:hypothetical protein
METCMRLIGRRALCAALGVLLAGTAGNAATQTFSWSTIANNGDLMPGTSVLFNSYGQPSINEAGLLVFQGRGKGVAVPPRGIYVRDAVTLGPLTPLATNGTTVPAPNNTLYSGTLGTFISFPSIPRIDGLSPTVAFRSQHQPVYTYMLGATETRVGTTGGYTNAGGGPLLTGSSLLGAVVENSVLTFPWYSVPGALPGTRFDQFPGTIAVSNGTMIAFKGNYTDPVDLLGKTGVYFRDVVAAGGTSPTYLIANSVSTVIPNQPAGGTVKFGSTAPPSTANGHMYFVGSDIEEAPTLGGIYAAQMAQPPVLLTLVGIGSQVPREPPGATFSMFGEGLSVSTDGRYVLFWAKWGSETVSKTLYCPTDGNADLIAYCLTMYPAGFVVQIPVHQGIFVHDVVTDETRPMAKTLNDGITDFLYWVYSGAPPGVGGGEEGTEPPRWRNSAFGAISANATSYQVAFKARRAGVNGIYLRPAAGTLPLLTVVEIAKTLGQSIDPEAPANSIVSSAGLERDGFRGNRLAITVGMHYETTEESLGWAGVYVTPVPPIAACSGFTDVDPNNQFCVNVAWLKNRAITLGCAPGLYCPGATVNRLSLAAFLNRFGTALSAPVLTGSATGPVDLDGGPAICQTTDFVVDGFPRRAYVIASISGTANANTSFEAIPAASFDGGATWSPLTLYGGRATVEADQWAALRVTGSGDLDAGMTARFGLFVGRGGPPGATDLTDSRCTLRATIGNRNADLPPFDAKPLL